LHLNWLRPFPSQAVKGVLEGAKKILLIENNFQGQLGQWIRMQTGIKIKDRFLKYDGRQFYPEEIRGKIDSIFSQ
jgi:2-oxoglutarate ferredoxin oxidoreductase subunit alpha